MAAPDHLARLVRQHAETAQLLGVDFLPKRVDATPSASTPAAARPSTPEPAPMSAPMPSGKPASKPTDEPTNKADLLDQLRARYEADAPHAAFVTDFNSIVFGDGDPDADLMFIGEAPGREEDLQGIPFVGRAGQLLNSMIEAMGLTRQSVYIANVLKTRPPNNATPTKDEATACAPYLFGQISIVRPKAIVTLGLPASQTLLETTEAMGKMRGTWRTFRVPDADLHAPGLIPAGAGGLEIPVMPTYHPAYLLRAYTAENRKKVWSDLQQVMAKLG